MAKVLHSDQRFIYRDALRRLGVCDLKLIDADGQKILLVTERCYNTGPSVTNAIEHVVTAAYEQLGNKLPPLAELLIVEHYDELSYKGREDVEPTFDVVRFQREKPLDGPVWTPLHLYRDPASDWRRQVVKALDELSTECTR